MTKLAALNCFLCSVLILATAHAEVELPRSGAVILVDTSASFSPLREAEIEGLKRVARAVEKMVVEEWDTPVFLFWTTIGSYSETSDPPCGQPILYNPGLVNRKREDSEEKRQRGRLRAWFDACLEIFSSGRLKPDLYTDISSAVEISIAALPPQGHRVLVIISDLEEDLPPNKAPIPLRLQGEKVVMIYGPSRSDRQKKSQMFARKDRWKKRFEEAGASRVCDVPLKGISTTRILGCLQP